MRVMLTEIKTTDGGQKYALLRRTNIKKYLFQIDTIKEHPIKSFKFPLFFGKNLTFFLFSMQRGEYECGML